MPRLVVLAEQLMADVPGGTGRYTRELAAALAAAAPNDWSVSTVVAWHRDPTRALIPGVEGPRVLPVGRRALAAAWLRGVPLWPGGDSVHAPTPFAPPAPRPGRGLVVTVHDTVPWTHPHTLTPRGVSWHRRAIGAAARRASAMVVPTAAVSAEITSHVQPQCRVHVVGGGVAAALADPPGQEAADAVARRLDLPPRYLLTVGTLEPRKGIDVLLAALAGAPAPPLPLVLVGPHGWGGVEPLRLADQVGLDRARLRLFGQLTDAELAVVLNRAAALVVPSLAEGFGLPLLEAMAAGVPVVHSDVPALVEVAGGAGVTARRGDPASLAHALRAVLADPERTAGRIAAGRRRAGQFSWARAAAEVWRIHLDLHRTMN